MSVFSFLDHLNLIEDDSSRYEIEISDEGFSYLDLASEKKVRQISFEDKQKRDTGAALDGTTRARGQSNLKRVETIEHDEVCLDTDLLSIVRDIETRKNRKSVFPWTLGAASTFTLLWLTMISNASQPLLALTLSSLVIVPTLAFGLVNAWFWDRSRKDVHFAYKISGRGEQAFQQLNSAIEMLKRSGQTLVLSGKRHFEDTRYTGGAAMLRNFKKMEFKKGNHPLLDLPFEVWHMNAFHRDLYFMPDHILVCEGSKLGGVSYGKIELSTTKEVEQIRSPMGPPRDAKIVGKTFRFVNKDGSPDKRFNNNTEIPLVEYGVVNIEGAGLHMSIFTTNQSSALGMPNGLASIRDLSAKPIRKVAEQRREAAVERRLARQHDIFSIVLDAMNCIMFADGHASQSEHAKIHKIMSRIRSPWSEPEISRRIAVFGKRLNNEGLSQVVAEVCMRAGELSNPRHRDSLTRCLDHLVKADGTVHPAEIKVRNQIVAAMAEHPPT